MKEGYTFVDQGILISLNINEKDKNILSLLNNKYFNNIYFKIKEERNEFFDNIICLEKQKEDNYRKICIFIEILKNYIFENNLIVYNNKNNPFYKICLDLGLLNEYLLVENYILSIRNCIITNNKINNIISCNDKILLENISNILNIKNNKIRINKDKFCLEYSESEKSKISKIIDDIICDMYYSFSIKITNF